MSTPPGGGSPFAQPGGQGDKFEPGLYNGRLLLLYAKSYNGSEATKFGETTSADVDLIVVDAIDPQTGGPVVMHNARVFGNLARSVRDDIGGVVLGRLGQGPNTKGNPPWILEPHTDADAQLSGPIHQQYTAGLFKPKEQPPQVPQQQTYAPPPAAQYLPQQANPYALPPAPQQAYAPAPPAPATVPVQAAPVAEDPNIAKLIRNGFPPDKVYAMDPQTLLMVAASYQ